MNKQIYVSEHNYMEVYSEGNKIKAVKGVSLSTPSQLVEMDYIAVTFNDGTVQYFKVLGQLEELVEVQPLEDTTVTAQHSSDTIDHFDTAIQCDELSQLSSPLFDAFPLHQTVII